MATIRDRLKQGGRFKRRVESGQYPLYRMSALGLLISAILQAVSWRVPDSLADQSDVYTAIVAVSIQLLGSLLILVSVELPIGLQDSLQMERIGVTLVATTNLLYFVAVVIQNGSFPISSSLWLSLSFGLYCVYRGWEITSVLRQSRKEALS